MPRTLCKNARSGIERDKQTEKETESWKRWICLALRPRATELGQTVAGHLCQQISVEFSFMCIQKLISPSVCVHLKTSLHNARLCWFQMELNIKSRTIRHDPYGAACWKMAFKHKTKKEKEREEISQEKPPERLTLLRHAGNLKSCTVTNSGLTAGEKSYLKPFVAPLELHH